jgi:hypothetical protein
VRAHAPIADQQYWWKSIRAGQMPLRSDKERLREIAAEDSSSDEDTSDEVPSGYVHFHMRYRILTNAMIVIGFVSIGTAFLMLSKSTHWSFSASLYVITQIITTIGYGDLTVDRKDTGDLIFMILFVFFGIAIVANILTAATDYIIQLEKQLFRNRLHEVQASIEGDYKPRKGALDPGSPRLVVIVALMFLLWINLWAAFYSTYESCTCGYGVSQVAGCKEYANGAYDYGICEASGGSKISYFQGIYEAVITFSTVGFGDFTPKTRLGRSVAIPGMLIGVGTFGLLVSTLTAWFHKLAAPTRRKTKCKKSWINKMDLNGDGLIRQNEFRLFFLLKEGLIEPDALDHIDTLFDKMDKNSKGALSFSELQDHLDEANDAVE